MRHELLVKHSAMSSQRSYERCPQAAFISEIMKSIRLWGLEKVIFKRYTDLIEPMSIDEAS